MHVERRQVEPVEERVAAGAESGEGGGRKGTRDERIRCSGNWNASGGRTTQATTGSEGSSAATLAVPAASEAGRWAAFSAAQNERLKVTDASAALCAGRIYKKHSTF